MMNINNLLNACKPFRWRLLLTILGFVAALSFLILGFGKTMVILLCCGVGYGIGLLHDKGIPFMAWVQYWREKW